MDEDKVDEDKADEDKVDKDKVDEDKVKNSDFRKKIQIFGKFSEFWKNFTCQRFF